MVDIEAARADDIEWLPANEVWDNDPVSFSGARFAGRSSWLYALAPAACLDLSGTKSKFVELRF